MAKGLIVSTVAFHIGAELCGPIAAVALRGTAIDAGMLMPEASSHLYCDPLADKNNIRTSGQVMDMRPIT
jgi:hypothetical protein